MNRFKNKYTKRMSVTLATLLAVLSAILCILSPQKSNAGCNAPDGTYYPGKFPRDVTPTPNVETDDYFSDLILKALNFSGGYFSVGSWDSGRYQIMKRHTDVCCPKVLSKGVGHEIKELQSYDNSANVSCSVSSAAASIVPSLVSAVIAGLGSAYPDSVMNLLAQAIDNITPAAGIGNLNVSFNDDYQILTGKDECEGCPTVEKITTGVQTVSASASGASGTTPQIGPVTIGSNTYMIPSYDIKILQVAYNWEWKAGKVGRTVKTEELETGSFFVWGYKKGADAPVMFGLKTILAPSPLPDPTETTYCIGSY